MNAKEKLLRLADEFIKFAEELDEKYPPKIDFSILNDEDVFYCDLGRCCSKFIFKGYRKEGGYVILDYYIDETGESGRERYLRSDCPDDCFEKLRKVTEKETKLFYKHFPELEPPKVGDWGWFWDNLTPKEKVNPFGSLSKLSQLMTDYPSPYIDIHGDSWKNFQKIDPSKSLDEIIKDFGL